MAHGTRPLIRTLTLPAQANLNGGIFGGWILGELDKAAGLLGAERAHGPCTTKAVQSAVFLSPLRVGEDFQVYGEVVKTGRSSMHLSLEGWAGPPGGGDARRIIEATFVCVAIDHDGHPRGLPQPPPT